jgi:hypothetical protein
MIVGSVLTLGGIFTLLFSVTCSVIEYDSQTTEDRINSINLEMYAHLSFIAGSMIILIVILLVLIDKAMSEWKASKNTLLLQGRPGSSHLSDRVDVKNQIPE